MAKKRRPRGYGSVQKMRNTYYAKWVVDGETYRRPAEDKDDAEALLGYVYGLRKREKLSLAEALARLDSEGDTSPTYAALAFSKVFRMYLEESDRTKALRESTRRSNHERSGVLFEAPWASTPLDCIRRRDVRAWVAERMAQGASGKTVTNDLTLASSVWRFAEERGLVDDDANNPFLRARPRRYARKTRQALEPAELLVLRDAMAAAAPDAYPLLLAAVFSGWRIGELCSLRESDLDLEHTDGPRMTIDPEREKTGKTKVCYLGEPLVSLLEAEREARPRLPTALVFTTRSGAPWTPWTRLSRLREALGTVSDEDIPRLKRDGDDTRLGLDWHTIRHSVSTLLDHRGHRSAAIGELLGQADVNTRRRYTHPYQDEAHAIAADLATFLRGDEERQAAGQ